MFDSWVSGVVFGIVVTFFSGVIASVVARADVNKMKSNT